MSMFCKTKMCEACKGMCSHEKIIVVVVLVVIIAALGHYAFMWF